MDDGNTEQVEQVEETPEVSEIVDEQPEETGGETEGGDEGEEALAPVRQPKNDPEKDFYKRRADELEAQVRTARTAAEAAAARQREEEMLAQMDPEQRLEYRMRQQEQKLEWTMRQAELRIQDSQDRADYSIKAAKNPLYAKYADEVEKRIQDARNQGYHYSRDVVIKQIVGEKALASAEKGGSRKQRAQATENKTKSQTKATPAMGDKKYTRSAQSDKAARNERLKAGRHSSAYH